jgi:Mrp family chromosome partitioning ATPase
MVPTVLARKTLAQLKQFEVTVLGVALNDVAPSKEYGRGYYDDRRRTDAAKQA